MYGRLWDNIHHHEPCHLKDEVQPSFTTHEAAITEVIEAQGRSATEPFAVAVNRGCRVFVWLHPQSPNILS
jgi:hypothetical protein